jgi:hypothetical protein
MFKRKNKTTITVIINSYFEGDEFASKFEVTDEYRGVALRKADRKLSLTSILSNEDDDFCTKCKKSIDVEL